MPANFDPVSALLAWYDKNARTLPWRAPRGTVPDPYHVWLSEIMLQQTTVITVKPYFEKFLTLFPTIEALAAAPDDAVMAAWAGLGYYSRARNLLKCARLVADTYAGRFPDSEAELLTLPGIGPYTAAAIAAIAFNRQAAPVDGNIERVLARLYHLETPLPALKPQIKQKNAALVPAHRPGDFAQAMMDLGATLCTPKRPNCLICPWQKGCAAQQAGLQETLPKRAPKKPKPERHGTVYWLENGEGEVLLHRRPDQGLLGGMLCFPSTGWDSANDTALPQDMPTGWTPLDNEVVHVFTHFRLTLRVRAHHAPKGFRKPRDHIWLHPRDFPQAALPSLMKKIWKSVLLG